MTGKDAVRMRFHKNGRTITLVWKRRLGRVDIE